MGARGPAPLPEHLRRRHRIGVWLNEGELAELELRLAAPGLAALVMHGGKDVRKGLKVASEQMRARILGMRLRLTVPEVNRQAYADLGRLGSNVNQIAASINCGSLDMTKQENLRAVFDEISELRKRLLGMSFNSALDDAQELEDGDEFGLFVS
jgi:hypothetical protein